MIESHIGVFVTLGIALAGGIWALVRTTASLTREATEIKMELKSVAPKVDRHEGFHTDHREQIARLHTKVAVLEHDAKVEAPDSDS